MIYVYYLAGFVEDGIKIIFRGGKYSDDNISDFYHLADEDCLEAFGKMLTMLWGLF